MVGRALTIKTATGDNLAVHYALHLVREGDVLVIDGGGQIDRAIVGEIVARQAIAKGAVGIVVDGPARDVEAIAELGLPVYGTTSNPLGPFKNGPGSLNYPVQIGGVVVNDGDLVVGDYDGVVFVPQSNATEVLTRSNEQIEREVGLLAKAGAGQLDLVSEADFQRLISPR